MGRAPVPGWLAEYDWTGWMAHEDLPLILDPASGALATANANWLPEGYGGHITFDWDEHFRQERVEKLVVDAQEAHTPATMEAIQLDDYSPALVQFRDAALRQIDSGQGQEPGLLDALRRWDGRMRATTPEPLILTAWWRQLEQRLFADELGKDKSRFANGYLTPVLKALSPVAARDWCDDIGTGRRESCGSVLAAAFDAAMKELSAAHGREWREWRWGEAHMAFGEHRPFSSVGALSRFFSIAMPSAGGSYTLLRGRTDFSEAEPYRNVHASAFRGIYDLGDPDASRFVISSGQSGHFLSPHYRDLARKWSRLEYVAISTRPEDYRRPEAGHWVLSPR